MLVVHIKMKEHTLAGGDQKLHPSLPDGIRGREGVGSENYLIPDTNEAAGVT